MDRVPEPNKILVRAPEILGREEGDPYPNRKLLDARYWVPDNFGSGYWVTNNPIATNLLLAGGGLWDSGLAFAGLAPSRERDEGGDCGVEVGSEAERRGRTAGVGSSSDVWRLGRPERDCAAGLGTGVCGTDAESGERRGWGLQRRSRQ